VFGVALDACTCTELWQGRISFASFSSYGESLWLKRWCLNANQEQCQLRGFKVVGLL